MTNDIEPRSHHSAVHLDNCVIIFGGVWDTNLYTFHTRVIRTYNLFTEVWEKYEITHPKDAPKAFSGAVAVTIHGTIYTFGGSDTKERNALWKLSRTREGFMWSFIKPQRKEESSSPRNYHTGWEYKGKLWTFGGEGPSPEGYLHDHGDYDIAGRYNNQLLCYDPNSNKWTNPQCFGDVPSPRSGHACAIIKNKVWLFGGLHRSGGVDNMYELTLSSLTWAQIQIGQHRPDSHDLCSLTPLRDNCLVLHGGYNYNNRQVLSDTWIVDLTSHKWRLYKSTKDHARMFHTGWSGLSNNVIIFGGEEGHNNTYKMCNNIFHVMLEPKCLKQLAMQTIHKHQDALPWKLLPSKLISLLGPLRVK